MIRSSALYISIIISLLIVMICAAIIVIAYLQHQFYQDLGRKERLMQNSRSGIKVLLQEKFKQDTTVKLSLYESLNDTVLLEKSNWGIYELAKVTSFIGPDSLKKAYLLGFKSTDSAKALFLADEDRPLSISGKSLIRGTAYLPKAGINAGYVEGRSYEGSRLVEGLRKVSTSKLKAPDSLALKFIRKLCNEASHNVAGVVFPANDQVCNSFFSAPLKCFYRSGNDALKGKKISGNVIISSDSVLIADRYTSLDKVILIAAFVKIEDHFKGNLQVFATDSIRIGKGVNLTYPSALVLLKPGSAGFTPHISIGKDCTIEGQLFAWETDRALLPPLITIADNTKIRGEVYCKGYVSLGRGVEINGMVSTMRFLAKSSATLYDNYLIDAAIDRTRLSPYYLSPQLLRDSLAKRKVLCRLD